MYNFGELLNLGELDRYMLLKMQHILSLNAAFKSVMPAFHQPYANTFQDIHIQSTARNSTFQTVGYCEEVYFSLSTPLEEIIQLVTLKSQEIQNSYGMTGFNFETNSGLIQLVPIPPYTSPNEENARKSALAAALLEEKLLILAIKN